MLKRLALAACSMLLAGQLLAAENPHVLLTTSLGEIESYVPERGIAQRHVAKPKRREAKILRALRSLITSLSSELFPAPLGPESTKIAPDL